MKTIVSNICLICFWGYSFADQSNDLSLWKGISILAEREVAKASKWSGNTEFKSDYIHFLESVVENPSIISERLDSRLDMNSRSKIFLYCLRDYAGLNEQFTDGFSLVPSADILDIRQTDPIDLKRFWYESSICFVNQVLDFVGDKPSPVDVSLLITADRVMDDLVYRPIDISLFDDKVASLGVKICAEYGPQIGQMDFSADGSKEIASYSLALAEQMKARFSTPHYYFGYLHATSGHLFEKYQAALRVYACRGLHSFVAGQDIPSVCNFITTTSLPDDNVGMYFDARRCLAPAQFNGWIVLDRSIQPVFEDEEGFISKDEATSRYMELIDSIAAANKNKSSKYSGRLGAHIKRSSESSIRKPLVVDMNIEEDAVKLGGELVHQKRELDWDQTESYAEAAPEDMGATSVFRFTNTGKGVVKIADVKSSCDCTTTKLDKLEYQPGEQGEIVADFKFGNRQGLQMKTIKVFVDHQDEPIVLTMKTLIPKVLDIGRTFVFWEQNKEPHTYEIDLKVEIEEPVHVVSVTSDNELIEARLEAIEGGKHYKLKVSPVSLNELVKARIAIQTDFPKEKPRTYYVYAHIK